MLALLGVQLSLLRAQFTPEGPVRSRAVPSAGPLLRALGALSSLRTMSYLAPMEGVKSQLVLVTGATSRAKVCSLRQRTALGTCPGVSTHHSCPVFSRVRVLPFSICFRFLPLIVWKCQVKKQVVTQSVSLMLMMQQPQEEKRSELDTQKHGKTGH